MAQWQRIHLPTQEMQEMRVQSLGWEDPLEESMATHSSILAWRRGHGQRSFLGYTVHGQRSLVGYTVHGVSKSQDTTEAT